MADDIGIPQLVGKSLEHDIDKTDNLPADDEGKAIQARSDLVDGPELSEADLEIRYSNLLEFICADCLVEDSPMWRRLSDDKVVCSLCHIKRVKTLSQGVPRSSTKTKDGPVVVRSSSRKTKSKKKFTNLLYGEKITKNGGSKSRRSVLKKKPFKAIDVRATVVTSKSVYHNGILMQIGDVVCTSDVEGGTYYAQVRGFLTDEFCIKSVVVTWLIPTRAGLTCFEPNFFVPGLDEDKPRSLECFEFVCRAPSDLFKAKIGHSPYLRTQSDLNALVLVAERTLCNEQIKDDALHAQKNVSEDCGVISATDTSGLIRSVSTVECSDEQDALSVLT